MKKVTFSSVKAYALPLCLVPVLGMMTGCSAEPKNEPTPGQEEEVVTDEASKLSYAVYSGKQSRVHNYSTGSRAFYEDFDMPECPEVPEGIATTTGIGENDGWKISEGVDYLIPAGETLKAAFKPTATYYVAGTWDITNGLWDPQGAQPVIYILPGGTLNIGSTIQPGITIYNYGTLTSDNQIGICISRGVKVYSAVDVICPEVDFGVNANNGEWDNVAPGEFYGKGTIVARNVRLNGHAAACAFIAENEITFNDNGTMKASMFKAPRITMHASKIILDQYGIVLATEELFLSNADTRISVDGTKAVVAAPKFRTNNVQWAKNTFLSGVIVDFKEAYIAETLTPINDFELVTSDENLNASVPAAGCHGNYNEGEYEEGEDPAPEDPEEPVEPTPDPDEPEIIIEKVTDLDPIEPEDPDHEHGVISATCITFHNGVAYASYHLRGNGDGVKNSNYVGTAQKGCIEVINCEGEEISLGSYMISPDYDYNHLIVDNGYIIAVGNHAKKGAYVGRLPLGFAASEGVREDFEIRVLTTDEPVYGTSDKTGEQIIVDYWNAGDGNCILRQGDNYLVATYEGYGVLDLNLKKVKGTFNPTTGSAKHLAQLNGKTGVVSLTQRKVTSSPAILEVFDGNLFTGNKTTYNLPANISPIDGKNVLAMDGDEMYVCLSQGGLARVSDGKVFTYGENGKVPANGMAIDENYLYVAMGSFVVVLDKATMEEVCHYHAASEKSANYIALQNGLIYVAFGEDGIQVFKLRENI